MSFFPMSRLRVGLEISEDSIQTAIVHRNRGINKVTDLHRVNILSGVLEPSFKKLNFPDDSAMSEILKDIKKTLPSSKVRVSIPNASAKILIRRFKDIPEEDKDINEMVHWSIKNSLKISNDKLRLSWQNLGQTNEGDYCFLIALSLEEIIDQYETVLKKAGLSPMMISPSSLNQFNFYAGGLPDSGNIAYTGLYDDYITLFVFSDTIPVFYKTAKKGLLGDSNASAINDIDLLLQYYVNENPEVEIESLFVASHIKSKMQVDQLLQDAGNAKIEILDEEDIIDLDPSLHSDSGKNQLPFYASALGAALGA